MQIALAQKGCILDNVTLGKLHILHLKIAAERSGTYWKEGV